MILILSQTKPNDKTTEDIIDWLRFYKIPFKRINGTDFIENVGFEPYYYIKLKHIATTCPETSG